MKIQYMSDLHLEFADMPVPEVLGDVLILAGDIHVGTNAIPWIEQCAQVFEKVFYVLGNHEYYGQKFWKLPDQINASMAGYSVDEGMKLQKIFDPISNAHLLDNNVYTYKGVNFIGSTLWSKANPFLAFKMNDFKRITYKHHYGYGKFTPEAAQKLFFEAKGFLEDSIVAGSKNVVITHFAPTYEMISSRYQDDTVMNTGYATEILQDFDPADIAVWISGHTHGVVDKVVNGIHTVSNCRGYVPYEANPNFNPVAIVEV